MGPLICPGVGYGPYGPASCLCSSWQSQLLPQAASPSFSVKIGWVPRTCESWWVTFPVVEATGGALGTSGLRWCICAVCDTKLKFSKGYLVTSIYWAPATCQKMCWTLGLPQNEPTGARGGVEGTQGRWERGKRGYFPVVLDGLLIQASKRREEASEAMVVHSNISIDVSFIFKHM